MHAYEQVISLKWFWCVRLYLKALLQTAFKESAESKKMEDRHYSHADGVENQRWKDKLNPAYSISHLELYRPCRYVYQLDRSTSLELHESDTVDLHFLLPCHHTHSTSDYWASAAELLSFILNLRVSLRYLILSRSVASSSGMRRNLARVIFGFAKSLTQSGYSSLFNATIGSFPFVKLRPGMGVPGFMACGETDAREKHRVVAARLQIWELFLETPYMFRGNIVAIITARPC